MRARIRQSLSIVRYNVRSLNYRGHRQRSKVILDGRQKGLENDIVLVDRKKPTILHVVVIVVGRKRETGQCGGTVSMYSFPILKMFLRTKDFIRFSYFYDGRLCNLTNGIYIFKCIH